MKKAAGKIHRKLVGCSLFIWVFFMMVHCAYSAQYANPGLLADVTMVADNMGKGEWLWLTAAMKRPMPQVTSQGQ